MPVDQTILHCTETQPATIMDSVDSDCKPENSDFEMVQTKLNFQTKEANNVRYS